MKIIFLNYRNWLFNFSRFFFSGFTIVSRFIVGFSLFCDSRGIERFRLVGGCLVVRVRFWVIGSRLWVCVCIFVRFSYVVLGVWGFLVFFVVVVCRVVIEFFRGVFEVLRRLYLFFDIVVDGEI